MSRNARLVLAFITLALWLMVVAFVARPATLGWDISTDVTVTGYKIHQGFASGVYSFHTSVGNVTSTPIPTPPVGGRYYFAATSYNALGVQSPYSNEVTLTNEPPTPSPSPSPTETPTITPTPTPTETPSPTAEPTGTPEPTVSPSPTVTPAPGWTPGPSPAGERPQILGIGLVSNETGEVLRVLQPGDTINLAALPTLDLNIQVFVRGEIVRVMVKLDTWPPESDTHPPYTLCGAWYSCNPGTLVSVGDHSIRATAYGTLGRSTPVYTVVFTLINE